MRSRAGVPSPGNLLAASRGRSARCGPGVARRDDRRALELVEGRPPSHGPWSRRRRVLRKPDGEDPGLCRRDTSRRPDPSSQARHRTGQECARAASLVLGLGKGMGTEETTAVFSDLLRGAGCCGFCQRPRGRSIATRPSATAAFYPGAGEGGHPTCRRTCPQPGRRELGGFPHATFSTGTGCARRCGARRPLAVAPETPRPACAPERPRRGGPSRHTRPGRHPGKDRPGMTN
jgi:hypothetical protein